MISTHRIMPASHTRQWWLAGGIHPSQVVAAYQPKGAVDLAASYVNLANPGTNDAQVGVAPALDSSGWVFGGSQHVNTGVVPDENYCLAIRIASYSTGNIGGIFDSVTRFYIGSPIGHGSQTFAFSPSSNKTIVLNERDFYVDGALINTFTSSWTNTVLNIWLGGRNNSGSLLGGVFTTPCAVIYNAKRSPAQIAALSAAMAAL